MMYVLAGILLVLAGALAFLAFEFRRRHLNRWFGGYLAQTFKRRPPGPNDTVHVLLCFADHYEPKGGGAPPEVASARVRRWVEEYPRQFARFRDSDGRPPRYTFFYPQEEYEAQYLDALAELCRQGFGEVEVHLHHDADTPEGFREKLVWMRDILANRHGLLGRDKATGKLAFGFIHGNWALCNSRPDGRYCGVNNELTILRETGCYADFTMPSAPHETQTAKINSLYYAVDRPGQARSHDRGRDVGTGLPPADALLLIQGPLVLDWRQRRHGVLPSLENGCLQGSQPACIERLAAWLRARIQVPGRPDWFFVKLHAHGAAEESHDALLGPPMVQFHEALARLARDNPRFQFHYVTAREMFNLAKAAEAGWQGSVNAARDFLVESNVPAPESASRIRAGSVSDGGHCQSVAHASGSEERFRL